MEELAVELRRHGFTVATLTGAAATKEEVDRWLKSAFASLSKLDKQDVALFGFSGHGTQSLVKNPVADQPDIEDAFFCPVDALKSRTDTMISISWVMRQLDASSGSSQNLVLVDACRNNPNKGMKTIDGSTAKELPSKISVLFSSSGGERSYESAKAKHGVFTHVLLQGLRGEAAFDWEENDIFVLPNFLWRRHRNTGAKDAVLYAVSDLPLMEKIGQYRAQGKAGDGRLVQLVD